MAQRKIPIPVTEAQHQSALFMWAAQPSIREKWPILARMYHIPNGGARDEVEAANLKRQGVKRGVPDLCLPTPRGPYHGMYIELKRADGGKTSPDQDDWIEVLNAEGYYAEVCHGWLSAKRVIEWYLTLPKA